MKSISEPRITLILVQDVHLVMFLKGIYHLSYRIKHLMEQIKTFFCQANRSNRDTNMKFQRKVHILPLY